MIHDYLTMSVTKISAFLSKIEYFGVDKTHILNSAVIESHFFNSPDNRLTSGEVTRIFLAATKLTKNENIGLHQGEGLSKGFSNILGYLLMNCSDLADAAQKYIKYERIVDETSVSDICLDGNTVILSIRNVDKELKGNRQMYDFKLAGMLSYMKILLGESIILKEVHFEHCKPQDISEYQRIFKCPVFFEKQMNALVFNKELLQLPIIEPNNELQILFERIARDTLEKLGKSETYKKKVLDIIIKEMNGEIPSINLVAKRLAMSIRSLQHNLKQEGTSYIKIANEVRKNIAINFLKEKDDSISEIAYFLGFSEASAFNRAFKKWTNLTPGEFRARSNFQQTY